MVDKFTYFDDSDVLLEHMVYDFADIVSVICDFELLEELFVSLYIDYDYEIDTVEIDRQSYDGEYMLQINNDECTFSIEKAYAKDIDRYIATSGVIYVHDRVNRKCIRDLEDNDSVKPIILPFTFDVDLYQMVSEEENKYVEDEGNSCFDFDDDKCSFVYCRCYDGNKTRFVFRGHKPLTEERAMEIVRKYSDF